MRRAAMVTMLSAAAALGVGAAQAERPAQKAVLARERPGGEAAAKQLPDERDKGDRPGSFSVKAGRLWVRVVDPDVGVPVASRVQVFAHKGAKGRGSSKTRPVRSVDLDASGEASFALPPGSYELIATRGIEYAADRRVINVTAEGRAIELAVRRSVPTPGWVGCDLHMHARGSWDSSVSLHDRARSLSASGIDFAALSQHNRVGRFGDEAAFGWAPAVEITTPFGHFNAMPFASGSAPWKGAKSAEALLREVRAQNPEALIQINHPRYKKGMGYFHIARWATGTAPPLLPAAVDAIEVYNGFELPDRRRTELVLREWLQIFESGQTVWATAGSDVHGLSTRLSGFPRVYAADAGDDDAEGRRPDAAHVIAQLRAGRAFVTSGPLLFVSQDERGPGEQARVEGGQVRVRVRVLAAPWVDARDVEVWVGGRPVLSRAIAERALSVNLPDGTLDEVQARAVLFDEELLVPAPAGARSLVVVVRGDATVAGALPTMPYQPMAFSNPMLLEGN